MTRRRYTGAHRVGQALIREDSRRESSKVCTAPSHYYKDVALLCPLGGWSLALHLEASYSTKEAIVVIVRNIIVVLYCCCFKRVFSSRKALLFAHNACTQRLHTTPAHNACTQRLHTTPAHNACTQRLHTTPALKEINK